MALKASKGLNVYFAVLGLSGIYIFPAVAK